MGAARSYLSASIAVAIVAGSYVATTHPSVVHASAPTPGIITTYAGGSGGSGPGTGIAQNPGDIAIHGTGLYVPDYTGYVRVIDLTTGNETTIAGNGYPANTGDGGPATSASLLRPTSVAVDGAGDVYVTAFNAVRKIAPNGIITTAAGGGTGALGDGGPATSATVSPASVAVDSAGNLFIADGTRIREVDHTTGIITTYAGGSCCGPVPDGTPAASAAINVYDLAFDSLGNLWFADGAADRIYKIDHATGLVYTMAGSTTGYDAGDGGPATQAVLFGPVGISFDSAQNLYIAEGPGEVIRKFDHSTGVITKVAGTGTVGGSYTGGFNGDNIPALTAHLDGPMRSVVDTSGNLYIPSGMAFRVRKVDATTQLITTVAGNGGTCGNWGDGGPAGAAVLCGPTALTTDASGDLFMVDAGSIREVNAATGLISTVPGASLCCRGGVHTGLVVDGSGAVFVTVGQQVLKYAGGVGTVVAGNGTQGFTGDGGPATSAELSNPDGLAIDSAGDLLIADYSNFAIRKVDSAGIITTLVQPPFQPTSIAVDSKDDVFVASGRSSVAEYPKSGPATVNPSSLAADSVAVGPADRVFISVPGAPQYVSGGQTVYLLTSGAPVAVAGNGTTGFSGDGGPALSAQLSGPRALAVDAGGDIFISDDEDPHLRRVQAYTLPVPPGDVTAVPGDNSAKVHWYAPRSTGGLPITGYAVTPYANGVAGTPVVFDTAPLPLSYTASGLTNGVTYTFTVTATTGWGKSQESVPSDAVVPGSLYRGYITTHGGSIGSGPATSIAMEPFALALGPIDSIPGGINTHLYVGDPANAVIRDIALTTGQQNVAVGEASFGYSPDGVHASSTQMAGAGAVAYCNGTTYYADTPNYVIRKVDPNGVVTTLVGTGVRGFNGDGPGTSTEITQVYGLACEGPSLTFTDGDTGLVRIVDGTGNVMTIWHGFSFPTAVAYDPNFDLFVVDSGTNLVWHLRDVYPGPTIAVGGGAGCPPAPNQCLGTDLALNFPRSIAIDQLSGMYVADANNNRVVYVGSGGDVFNVINGFHRPRSVVLAPKTVGSQSLFVADTGSGLVEEVDNPSGASGPTATVAGDGFFSLSGDGGPATSAQLGQPNAVAADPAGDLFVADTANNELREITPGGTIKKVASIGFPDGLAFDTIGNLYVSDSASNVIDKVDPSTGAVVTYFSAGVLNNPGGIAFDASNDLFVADAGNNRVIEIAPGGGSYTVYAGSTVLSDPTSVRMIGGKLYVADAGHNRVVQVVNGTVTTIAGTGVAGFAGDGALATAAQLHTPFDVAGDASGNVYIADGFNQRIRMVDTSGKISTVVSICGGVAGFSGDAGPASTAQLNYPVGLAIDSTGNVYIADALNNRVREAAGLAGGRQSSCPGPESTPSGRGTNASSTATVSPRLASYGRIVRTYLSDFPVRAAAGTGTPKSVRPTVGAHVPPASHPQASAPTRLQPSTGVSGPQSGAPTQVRPATRLAPAAIPTVNRSHASTGRFIYLAALLPLLLMCTAVLAWRRRLPRGARRQR